MASLGQVQTCQCAPVNPPERGSKSRSNIAASQRSTSLPRRLDYPSSCESPTRARLWSAALRAAATLQPHNALHPSQRVWTNQAAASHRLAPRTAAVPLSPPIHSLTLMIRRLFSLRPCAFAASAPALNLLSPRCHRGRHRPRRASLFAPHLFDYLADPQDHSPSHSKDRSTRASTFALLHVPHGFSPAGPRLPMRTSPTPCGAAHPVPWSHAGSAGSHNPPAEMNRSMAYPMWPCVDSGNSSLVRADNQRLNI